MQEYTWIITEVSVIYHSTVKIGLLLPAKVCQVVIADVW
jgi:hypothetical protein